MVELSLAITAGVLLAVPLVGFAVWWFCWYRGSEKFKRRREVRLREAGVRREAREKVRREREAERRKVEVEREREERGRQEAEREKQVKRMRSRDVRDGESLGMEHEEFAKYGKI